MRYLIDSDYMKSSLTPRHYATMAKWMKEVGLIFLGSLVVQKLFLETPLADPVLILGGLAAGFCYGMALRFLLKS